MTTPLTPAEDRVFNLMSAKPAGTRLLQTDVEAAHSQLYGTYKGVSDALNSLVASGKVESTRLEAPNQPRKALFPVMQTWYSLPATQQASPLAGSSIGTGKSEKYRRDTVDLHNLGYII